MQSQNLWMHSHAYGRKSIWGVLIVGKILKKKKKKKDFMWSDFQMQLKSMQKWITEDYSPLQLHCTKHALHSW